MYTCTSRFYWLNFSLDFFFIYLYNWTMLLFICTSLVWYELALFSIIHINSVKTLWLNLLRLKWKRTEYTQYIKYNKYVWKATFIFWVKTFLSWNTRDFLLYTNQKRKKERKKLMHRYLLVMQRHICTSLFFSLFFFITYILLEQKFYSSGYLSSLFCIYYTAHWQSSTFFFCFSNMC